ncbi:MAG TPA: hypothetical protein VGP73_06650 [Thermoanaerobaculia bacterium]
MLINEFVSRFTTKDERSFLFEILRRVSRLDPSVMQATTTDPTDPSQAPGWVEWPSVSEDAVPALRAAQA